VPRGLENVPRGLENLSSDGAETWHIAKFRLAELKLLADRSITTLHNTKGKFFFLSFPSLLKDDVLICFSYT